MRSFRRHAPHSSASRALSRGPRRPGILQTLSGGARRSVQRRLPRSGEYARVRDVCRAQCRDAGMVILLSLALAGPAGGPFPPVAPVQLSINGLATAFSVSRKHVLALLRDAQAAGLLERAAAGDQITILPRARTAIEILLATISLFLAQGAAQSLALRAAPGATYPAAALSG